MKITHFFLGANTGEGFMPLPDALPEARSARRIYILKGGAGCGKSTFMKIIARMAEERGEDVEYLHCGSDADSLDGLALPRKKCALVDGTPPHVAEPKYLGAVERYVELGRFCHPPEEDREKLIAAADAYPTEYPTAYRLLRSAMELSRLRAETALDPSVRLALEKRADGVASREFSGKKSGEGRARRLFLDAIAPQGLITRYDTAFSLCERVYELVSVHGLSGVFLERLTERALEAGREIIICPSPLDPKRTEHLLIPGGAAFVTSGGPRVCESRPYRRLRLDNLIDRDAAGASHRLRFMLKTENALTAEAVEALARIKSRHDALEALYNPHVDFPSIRALAAETGREILE